MTPRVSAIIPTYNHARFVGEALTSVLAQTFTDLEVIVVDDGSTDDTREAVGAFDDPRVRYVYQANAGLGAARNTGIRHAGGEYIALLDADDRWEPGFLQRMVGALDENERCGAAYCGFRWMDAAGQPVGRPVVWAAPPEQFRRELVGGRCPSACSVVARARCYGADYLFDESLRACEDFDLWLRMSQRFPFLGLPEALVWYRRTGGNMTDDVERMFVNLLRVVRKHVGSPGLAAERTAESFALYEHAYRGPIVGCVAQGDVPAACRHYRDALALGLRLAGDLPVWYMIACAHQPFAQRGDFESLDLVRSARDVEAVWQSVWAPADDSTARPAAEGRLARAYGRLAVGLLAYGRGEHRVARAWLLRAARGHPPLVADSRWRAAVVRSILGAGLLSAARRGANALGLRNHGEGRTTCAS